MRHISMTGAVIAVLLSSAVTALAASSDRQYTSVSRVSSSGASSPVQTAASSSKDAVPANCIRQECGKLWCWQMKGASAH